METLKNATRMPRRRSASSMAFRPSVVWVFMTSNSSTVSLPGLSKMLSGIPILPMSCSGADL
ncbi:hypothetical protein D3C86_2172320 [compost metagenome]